MTLPLRPIAFVLAAANHGSMIVNRNDQHSHDQGKHYYGVGCQILNTSSFDDSEVGFVVELLKCRRKHFGDGVFAVDGGANIGVHTIEWARHMHGWGQVLSFEAQEVMYYALAGNVALNNCFNARVKLAALGEQCGQLPVPQPDYLVPASFGSLELRQSASNEFIGQPISYDAAACNTVPMVSLDSLDLARVDLIKLDIEGMEMEALRGAQSVLGEHRPILLIEIIKSDRPGIAHFLTQRNYRIFSAGMNIIAVHASDPTLQQITVNDNNVSLNTGQ